MASRSTKKRAKRPGAQTWTKGTRSSRSKTRRATQMIMAWQDDPDSGLPPIARDVPDLSKGPLAFRMKGTSVKPDSYQPGTPAFRYWTAAEALRRGADFWAPLLGVKQWQPGPVLPVGLDEGVDLNAYYDRSELAFFHGEAGGKTVYSGESPDVLCHEMGHACLDAHRPELWDAPFIEVGAFHESFGDMSAILSALQLPSVRQTALDALENDRSSDLSRLAEQLGWAIRQIQPSSVNSDCLRDACNAFDYVDPQTLPDSAPATALSAEVHSFSRVFTGAFYEILGGMVKARSSSPTPATIVSVAADLATLLLAATTAAPVQPNYYAQVASHMIDADTAQFGGRYRTVLASTFVDRKLLPQSAVEPLLASNRKEGRVAAVAAHVLTPPDRLARHEVRLSAAQFGLPDRPLIAHAPVERKPLAAVSAAMMHRSAEAPAEIDRATQRFVQMLFAHDRVETAPRPGARRLAEGESARSRRRTHVLEDTPQGLRLVRRQFDCGC